MPMENDRRVETQSINDDEVVDRVLHGEKDAYEIIMRKYNQRLFRIVRSYLKNEDEIEDVIQEAYIKAYEQMPRFEKRSRFSTWLIRIVINEALARLKHRKRFTSIADDASECTDFIPKIPEQLITRENPVGKLMNAELKDALEKAVDRLPEKYRSVFVMREIEGMSIEETSESLQLTETNVKVRLNRAKGMLRETISSLYRDVEIFQFNLVRCDRIVRNVLQRLG